MYKKGIILMSAISLLFGLAGCKTVKTDFEIKIFSYSYSTSWRAGDYRYSIKKSDAGIYSLTYCQTATKYAESTITLDNNIVSKIQQLCKKYNVNQWNGFNKVNNDVFDGNSWSLSIDFSDASVSASGYMCYPKNYREFVDAIEDLLQPYFEKCRQLSIKNYSDIGFNGNIESIFVNICTNGVTKKHSYFFNIYNLDTDPKQTKLYYSISINEKNDNDYLEIGKYYHDDTIELNQELFSTIKGIIDKYNVILYDGISEHDSNGEYYQLAFEYSNGQRLDVNGSKAFENYEDFRNELLEYLCSFVEK